MENFTTGYFNIGSHQPGAATFSCALVFDGSQAVGFGKVTQAINPPLDLATSLSGTVANIVWGADDTQVIALGGKGLRTPTLANLECSILLDSKSSDNSKARVSYLDERGAWIHLENLPVQVTWIRTPL